ncbi:hypothetical protein BgiMline_000458, partial [Biomphalaria glabrata]
MNDEREAPFEERDRALAMRGGSSCRGQQRSASPRSNCLDLVDFAFASLLMDE